MELGTKLAMKLIEKGIVKRGKLDSSDFHIIVGMVPELITNLCKK